MIKKLRKIVPQALLFLSGLIAIFVLGMAVLPNWHTQRSFATSEIELETYDLFDMGIADVNSDGWLDVFTTNHSARQSIAINEGGGQFINAFTRLGLGQDRQFPELEDAARQPEFREPGLYIYRYRKGLYLHSYQLTEGISGQVSLSWPMKVEVQDKAVAEINVTDGQLVSADDRGTDDSGTKTIVEFTIEPEGMLVLKGQDDIVELPHRLKIDPALPTEQIFVGLEGVGPNVNEFELMWRDRHSLAWVDLNRDKAMDVFIGRGAVKGMLDQVSDPIMDELMMAAGDGPEDGFEDQISQLGFEKKDCPGRQVAWVDFDSDNRLDLYIGCGRDSQPVHPNQLYQQQLDGRFVDVAPRLGLDFPEEGAFRWLDVDGDRDPDLLIVKDKSLWLYVQDAGQFKANLIEENFPFKIMGLLVSDFDADGDPDIYIESKQAEDSNLLLLNNAESSAESSARVEGDSQSYYTVQSPESIGLPNTGVGASWVDHDNDGRTDFYIAPGGLYRQVGNHRFQKSRLLDRDRWYGAKVVAARSAWVDMDNDGDRDLVTVLKQTPPLPIRLLNYLPKVDLGSDWQSVWIPMLYRNKAEGNHWLELELSDPAGISPAIGTKATVWAKNKGDLPQTQAVGEVESAYFSQGHYRLYFGLGKHKKVDAIKIDWPDGQTQRVGPVTIDQLLRIEKQV